MPPPILILRDIRLTFGGPTLLDGAALSLSAGDRLCLVGRNGSGKSTLLKIAAGMVLPDDGEVFLQPGTTVRYLPQEPDLAGFDTVLAYVEDGLARISQGIGRPTCSTSYRSTAWRTPLISPAVRRGARPLPGPWRLSRTSCCSTSLRSSRPASH